MSRSRRHTPICGNCIGNSEKYDKRMANRRLRRRHTLDLKYGCDLTLMREVSDSWSFKKDGKTWFGNWANSVLKDKFMRK